MKKYILSLLLLAFGMLNAVAQTVSVDDLTIKPDETKVVSINLNNSQTNIVSFQMDLTLPDGITINIAGCELGSRITDNDQELTIGKQPNGDYRLTSTSLSLKPISGTSGEIVKLSLSASASAKGGTASISNIRLATIESEKLTPNDVSFEVKIPYTLTYLVDGVVYKTSTVEFGTAITPEPAPTREGYTFSGWSEIPETMPNHDVIVTGTFYLMGDVNDDGEVDLSDAIMVTYYSLHEVPSNFKESVADMNGDGEIDLSDAIIIIYKSLGVR